MKYTPTAKMPGSSVVAAAKERFRKNDPISKRYSVTAWRKCSMLCRRCNSICQRIVRDPLTGKCEQCRNASTLAHHIVSPRQGGAMFDLKNLLALCDFCHPPDEGTPCWVEGVDFVASNYPRTVTGNEHVR